MGCRGGIRRAYARGNGSSFLRRLHIGGDNPPDPSAAGAALGALVAANAPALESLHISRLQLRDAGMRPLLDALPHNTHLSRLSFWATGMSAAFARQVVLPDVRTNTSLRNLEASAFWEDEPDGRKAKAPPELIEAEALVAARNEQ